MEVKTRAKRAGISGYDPHSAVLKIALKSMPVKGKANRELLKALEKELGRKARIVSGLKSKTKKVFIEGMGAEELREILSGKISPAP
ncbi:MAG: DUF167 domain-containing protein [Candidatus Diapherotrites archaeon]